MLELDLSRTITILFQQIVAAGMFAIIIYKMLRRNKNRFTYTFCSFFLFEIGSLTLNTIYLFVHVDGITYIIHFLATYFFYFASIFLVVFTLMILNLERVLNKKLALKIIIGYGLGLFLILFIFGWLFQGMRIDESTNWRPSWSLTFLIPMYIFLTTTISIPMVFLGIKIHRNFEDKQLKRKWMSFLIGVIIFIFLGYGLILYNTWNDALFKIIYGYVSMITLPASLMIYYGFIYES